ncbi:MAG: 4-hydroxythreonine-4-phosphate dehydrogenase PdxA [Armatimonadota bacterium]|nr:4-hydroxythreonine-4-phosphate dehydrogenase PdxA [Armatimonadota bacterium]
MSNTSCFQKPRIAITMGDPAGVGPEIVISAISDTDVLAACVPVVIGSRVILERCARAVGVAHPPADIEVVSVDTQGIDRIEPGRVSPEAGMAAEAYVRKACLMALEREIDAIATAPINKESLRLAGVPYIGHTEMLAAYLGSSDPLTMFVTGSMRIFFLTRHMSLRDAVDYVKNDRVYTFIKRVNSAMVELGFDRPRIGLAALNPHASDGGQFGDEEEKHLKPAAAMAREEGIDCSDPIGADSVFHMALEGRFDCVISLYHDQGHIAAKTRDFYRTVTATLGLPVLRTSVDHGTALDIAWKGIANPVSMKTAILTAVTLMEKQRSRR